MKTILKLQSTSEPVFIDELSIDELKEVLTHPKALMVSNLSSLVVPYLHQEDVLSLVEKLAEDSENFREAVIAKANIPDVIEEEFYIKEERFKDSYFKLEDTTVEDLKILDIDSLTVKVKRKLNSIFKFTAISESGNFAKVLGVNLAVVAVLASFTVLSTEAGMRGFGGKTAQTKVQRDFSGAAMGHTFKAVLDATSSSENPKVVEVFNNINSLTDQDVKNINELVNIDVELPVKKLSDAELKQQLVEVINSFYNRPVNNAESIAGSILKYSNKHKVDSKLMLAIIKNESDFRQSAVSRTGDISISQIKVPTWQKEFERRKRRPLDEKKLKEDSNYAIDRMAEIIAILQNNWKENDPYWFARYHSSTDTAEKPFKSNYAKKVQKAMTHISIQNLDSTEARIDQVLQSLKSITIEIAAEENIDFEQVQKLKEDLLYMKKTITAQISYKKNVLVAAN